MIKYQAKVFQDGKTYSVIFPDLPGCFSSGGSRQAAVRNARKAVSLYLEDIQDQRSAIPKALNRKGRQYTWIYPEANVAIPLMIRQAREAKGLSQSELARRLNMTVQQLQKLETPGKSNPTVRTLSIISTALDGTLDIRLVA